MTNPNDIADISVRYFQVPLSEPLGDAVHGTHTHFELITATVTLEDGSEGTGYTYTGGFGGRAVYQVLEHDLKPWLIGQDGTGIEGLWDKMNWKIHYVGRGGITTFAISAVDIALWDIKGKKLGQPLCKMAGGFNDSCKAYYGGIDLEFTVDKLVDNVKNQIAAGHTAVKIKLGKSTISEDLERVKAVREAIGPDIVFMVDANMSWSVERAVKTARELEKYDIFWLEEPIIPDDHYGMARLAESTTVPLAMGENLHTIYEHKHALQFSKIGFIQPDASNIGGITGWLKVADLAEGYNIPVCSHGMQELHVSLLSAVPHAGYLEIHSFPIDEYTMNKVSVKDGRAMAPETPGTGVIFNWDKLNQYEIQI